MSVASPGPNVEDQVILESKPSHDYHEHEELDFEEEFDAQDVSKIKNKTENGDNDEEGELSPAEDDSKVDDKSDNESSEKADDDKTGKVEDDLEEGEILSDDEPESACVKGVPKLQFIKGDEPNFNMNNRPYNRGYRQNRWQSDSNSISRNRTQPPLLRNVNASQYVLRPMPSNLAGENTWETTFKQAQEIITRSGADRESNGGGNRPEITSRRQRSVSPIPRDDPTIKRRRRSPSSEDEVERRHRLAFETAPWNSSRGERAPQQPLSRTRDTVEPYPTFRERDDRAYGRRNDSNGDVPVLPPRVDNRRRSRYSPDELHSSSSHSSYESRRFHPSSRGTPERRLPYERPSYEERSRYVEKNDSTREKSSSSGLNSGARLDRIPKKYSLNANENINLRSKSVASDKSFDSWSESLSDSSSSYFTDSDSKQQKKKQRDKKIIKKKKKDKKEKRDSRERRRRTLSRDHRSDSDRRRSKSISPIVKKAETKEPIKMQFKRKAGNNLQKSSLIQEDFISDDELPDFETAEAMIAEKRTIDNHDDDDDEDDIDLNERRTSNDDIGQSLTEEQRRDLEIKLEIINRKIDHKINSHKN